MKVLSWDIGIKNLAYCIVDTEGTKILHWEIIENTPNKDSLKLHNEIINNLESRPHLLDVDTVLIEKQPSFNPTMRMVSSSLYTYFYIRGVLQNTDGSMDLIFFSPRKKLDCTEEWISLPRGGRRGGGRAATRYAAIKKAGIELAYKKLGETHSVNGRWVSFLDGKKKKDDLADSWIQCLSWLEAKNGTKKVDHKKKKIIEWGKVTSKKPLKKVEGTPSEWTDGNIKWWLLQYIPAKYEITKKVKKKPTSGTRITSFYNNKKTNVPLETVFSILKEDAGERWCKIPTTIHNLDDLWVHYGIKKFYDKNFSTLG